MKIFLILNLLSHYILLCSVTQDFVFPTVKEQTKFAGVIFVGTVTHVTDPINEAVVTFDDVEFYKGCLKKKHLKVDNFRGGSLCGAGIPQVGQRIIVFACKSTNEHTQLSVNQYVPFSGWVEKNKENLQTVQRLTRQCTKKCPGKEKIGTCLDRETAKTQHRQKRYNRIHLYKRNGDSSSHGYNRQNNDHRRKYKKVIFGSHN